MRSIRRALNEQAKCLTLSFRALSHYVRLFISPLISNSQTEDKPAAETVATAQDDAAPKPAAASQETKKGRVGTGAEGVASLVAAAAVKGGRIGKKRSTLSRKKPASKPAPGASGDVAAATEAEPAAEKPKKEKIRRNWKEIHTKWKADKAVGSEPASSAAFSPPTEAPAAQEAK